MEKVCYITRTLHRDNQTAYLDINLVTAKNDGDVFAHPLEVTMPVRNILIGDAGRHIEHDDTTLTLNVVTITKTTKLLLSSGIPNIEADVAKVGGEA